MIGLVMMVQLALLGGVALWRRARRRSVPRLAEARAVRMLGAPASAGWIPSLADAAVARCARCHRAIEDGTRAQWRAIRRERHGCGGVIDMAMPGDAPWPVCLGFELRCG